MPCAPFLIGSVFAGMFALSPYLAFREYRGGGGGGGDVDNGGDGSGGGIRGVGSGGDNGVGSVGVNGAVGKWFEGKASAVLLLGSTAGLLGYGLTANGGDVGGSAAEFAVRTDV